MSTFTSSNTKKVHLETTPRVYYENYTTASSSPNYDLYPSLSRRIHNASHISKPKQKKQLQVNFISIASTSQNSVRRPYNDENDPLWQMTNANEQPEESPAWDLYPSVYRNAQNSGNERVRQRLHTVQNTLSR